MVRRSSCTCQSWANLSRCGHCKALAPEHEEVVKTLKEKNIKVAKVDCVDQAELCQAQDVHGYPYVDLFKYGYWMSLTTYLVALLRYSNRAQWQSTTVLARLMGLSNTWPSVSSLIVLSCNINLLTRQALPAVTEVTAANLVKFQIAEKMVLIAYISSTSKAPAPEFTALAKKNRDNYLFGITSDPQAIKAAGVPTLAVVLYCTFDEPTTAFPYPVSSSKVEDFENWLNELAIPILGEVNRDTYEIYVTSGWLLAYLFVDPSEKKTQDYINASSLWLPSIVARLTLSGSMPPNLATTPRLWTSLKWSDQASSFRTWSRSWNTHMTRAKSLKLQQSLPWLPTTWMASWCPSWRVSLS